MPAVSSVDFTKPTLLQKISSTYGRYDDSKSSTYLSTNSQQKDTLKINTGLAKSGNTYSGKNPANAANATKSTVNTTLSTGRTTKLTPDQQQRVDELKKIDTSVRAHEAAHEAAGAGLVRGKSFTYATGPEGKLYATAGEVKIEIKSNPDDPQETIREMEQVKRAALAPGDPSAQDRSVASLASSIESKAEEMLQLKEQISRSSNNKRKTNQQKLASAYSSNLSANLSQSLMSTTSSLA